MTEDELQPSSGEPAAHQDRATPPIALPSVTPPPPVTPPAGSPVAGPPTASYALGALAGNPRLGPPPGYQGSPTGAGFPWPAPATPVATADAAAPNRRGIGRVLTACGAALILLAGGAAIGHAAWGNSAPSTPSAATSPNSGSGSGSGSANGGGGTFGGGGFNGGPNSYGGFGGSGSTGSSSAGSGPSDSASIASKVDPGLVDINTSLGYQSAQAAGTGIVLTSDGEILTNNHVIDGATTISVTDVGNGKTYSASVVGYDRSHDIAVLQLHGASKLQTADIGDSSSVKVGQAVVGIGNAGGTGGTPSYAGGTVTALNQSITASDEGDGTSEQLTGLIQTNANIQAGDSGGSLVNSSGKVIGIDTAASAGFSFRSPSGTSGGGEGFAIPINSAISIAKQIEAGTASSTVHIGPTAFLGVEVSTASSGGSSQFGINNGFGNQQSASGAAVAGVVTSSPAQTAGLAQGDVITGVDNATVNTPDDLTKALLPHHPGDKVTIEWTDTNGGSHQARVQLSSGPPQ